MCPDYRHCAFDWCALSFVFRSGLEAPCGKVSVAEIDKVFTCPVCLFGVCHTNKHTAVGVADLQN